MSVLEQEISPACDAGKMAGKRSIGLYADVEDWAQEWLDAVKQMEPRRLDYSRDLSKRLADDYRKQMTTSLCQCLEINAPRPRRSGLCRKRSLFLKPVVLNASTGIGPY